MRSGEWKSSRLKLLLQGRHRVGLECGEPEKAKARALRAAFPHPVPFPRSRGKGDRVGGSRPGCIAAPLRALASGRSEEHTSELQSLMRISYAVFCLKKKNNHTHTYKHYRRVHIKPVDRTDND